MTVISDPGVGVVSDTGFVVVVALPTPNVGWVELVSSDAVGMGIVVVLLNTNSRHAMSDTGTIALNYDAVEEPEYYPEVPPSPFTEQGKSPN
ncbi:hypothetical protein GUJ93_ZPchr0008g12179 [Zizania palustris]|uniref:Uncharacterized protein n=1 Tax=Zizania palustris TaxID=103762 RepID=A0A8J5R022_ZIZPA|nr:hypothetical protein GUJ93_ZPchr0008g12179 [Zizania palustris]